MMEKIQGDNSKATVLSTRLRGIIDEQKAKTGKSLRDFAAEMKVSFTVLSDWQCGNKTPRADSLAILSNYFGVSADYLLGLSNVRSVDADKRTISEYTGLSEGAIDVLHMMISADVPDFMPEQKKLNDDTVKMMDSIIDTGYLGIVAQTLVYVKSFAEQEEIKNIEIEAWIKKRYTPEFYERYQKLLEGRTDGFYELIFEGHPKRFKAWVDGRTESQIQNDFHGRKSDMPSYDVMENSESYTYKAQRFVLRYAQRLIEEGKAAAHKKAGEIDGTDNEENE